MKKRLFFIPGILAGLLFLATGCEKVVEMDVPERNPLMVLYAVLQPDSVLRVQLTASRYVIDDQPIVSIPNAHLRLLTGGEEVGSWQYLANGVYELQGYTPTGKNAYKIEAEAPGFSPVNAEVFLPTPAVAPVILQIDTMQAGDGRQTVKIRIAIEDEPETRDFYRVQLMYRYNYYSYEQDGNGDIVVVDTMRTTVMSPIYSSIDEFNTISNMVTVCSYYSSSSCSLLFNDQLLKESTFTFDVYHSQYYYDPGMGYGNTDPQEEYHLIFSRINEGYYQYILSADKNHTYSDNPFAEPTSLFSNVAGGYGVLGASASVMVRIR